MLYKITRNLLIICVLFSASSFDALSNEISKIKQIKFEGEPIEMIVTFENLNPKRYNELNEVLLGFSGIEFVGSCPEMKAYFFRVNSEEFSSVQEAFDALTIKTKEFQPLLKIGASISHVQSECDKK